MSSASVALPGTCGELVRGRIEGVPFLVSCPIDRWSVVEVQLSHGMGWDAPPSRPKTAAAIQAAARYLGCSDRGGVLRFRSELPRSKGYASSTADVAGAIYGLGLALGRHLDPQAVVRLSPARIVQILKSISARELFRQYPYLRRELWGGKLWSDGYFASCR